MRVYDTHKWQLVGEPLSGHTLTVTSIAFSPDDKYILSASRDRSWYLYERKEAGGMSFITFDGVINITRGSRCFHPGGSGQIAFSNHLGL